LTSEGFHDFIVKLRRLRQGQEMDLGPEYRRLPILLGVCLALALASCKKGAGAGNPAEGPYCDVVSTYVPSDVCAALQAQASRESDGTASLNAPNPMRRGDTVSVYLAVADQPPKPPPQTLDHRRAPVPSEAPGPSAEPAASSTSGSDTGASASTASTASSDRQSQSLAPSPAELVSAMPGHTESFTLTVGQHMAADLAGDAAFSIKPRTPRQQLVHLGVPYPSTVWGWDVTALHGGAHTLTVTTIVQAVDASGASYDLLSTPRAYSFNVKVTPLDQVKDALETAPTWVKLVTAVVVALSGLVAAIVGLRKAFKGA
jgi:hypothetical protein